MRKFIKMADSDEMRPISPLSFVEFCGFEHWSGANDMAYRAWLSYNELVILEDFTDEALATATFHFSPYEEGETYYFDIMGNNNWLPLEALPSRDTKGHIRKNADDQIVYYTQLLLPDLSLS